MIAGDTDRTGKRCELCGELGAPYITRAFVHGLHRDMMHPPQVITGRKCKRCMQGACQVTLYHVAERCTRPSVEGTAACKQCTLTVKNVMHRTLQRYGIELG